LNNAKRWPVYGRTSGMRCVIARAERPWMALAPFRSDHIPFAGSNLQLRCPSAPYPNLLQKFSSSFYSDEKKPVFSDRFLKWSAREDYPALRAAPCGPLLKQRCLAALGSNLLWRFSSSFYSGEKKPVFSDRLLKWSAREDYLALRACPAGRC